MTLLYIVNNKGVIDQNEIVKYLKKIYKYNPLFFDFAHKRLLQVTTKDQQTIKFPDSVF